MTGEPGANRRRIVILGGGFGGAYCAQALERRLKGSEADVLLLDDHNYFIFYPLLVEAGTGSLEPRHAIVPIRHFLSRRTRFRLSDVRGVDVESRRVTYRVTGESKDRAAEYDHLVIALGSVTSLPPVKGLKEHGMQMKTLSDSVALRDRMVRLLEQANLEEDEEKKRGLLHLVVVGGNYSGIEVAGEFSDFLREGTQYYRNLKPSDVKVTVVEREGRILLTLDEGLAEYALKKLRDRGLEIRLNQTVTEVHEDHVTYESGETEGASTVVWCAGIAQNPVAKELPFEKDKRGYILCNRDLRVKGQDNVWGIGDCAVNPDAEGNPYPATAQHAVRQGKHLARNLVKAMRGEATENFDYKSMGTLAPLGCRTAVAQVMGIKLSGFLAWWVWRTVYLMKMPTLSRKFRVALDWTVTLFFPHDYTHLDLHRPKGRGE